MWLSLLITINWLSCSLSASYRSGWLITSESFHIEPWESQCKDESDSLFHLRPIQNCSVDNFHSKYFRLHDDDNSVRLTQKFCFNLTPVLQESVRLHYKCAGGERRSAIHSLRISRSGGRITSRPKAKRSLGSIIFDQDDYSAEVVESQPSGTLVTQTRAHSPDRLPLFYSLAAVKDGRSASLFRINRTSGEIHTQLPLDREQLGQHHFRVSAHESGNPSHSATALLTINVLDVNDHQPVFEKSNYIASLSENAEVGTTVLHVHARDPDLGPNGAVEYAIVDPTDLENFPFTLDPHTGLLSVRKQLDRELKSFYRLTVQAGDRAELPSERRYTDANVEITVEDENDNKPEFNQTRYEFSIREDLDPSSHPVVAKVTAIDRDSGDNGRVHYSFVSGNVRNLFAIDYATGQVSLIGRLEYKQSAQYEMVIRAQDSGVVSMSNTALLILHVIDVNDHTPTFYATQFQESVMENVPVGHEILRIQAFDGDEGENAEIRYSIGRPFSTNVTTSTTTSYPGYELPFSIDELTGSIRVKKVLDREKTPLLDFLVFATDLGNPPLSSSVKVSVKVLDFDDNIPTFEQSFYNVSVPENAPKGYEILQLTAYDADESSVDYSISGGNEADKFLLISRKDGALITVNDRLDFKRQKSYRLSVRATDSRSQFDETTVAITVVDINSAPYFVSHEFSFTVKENEPVGHTVMILKAFDKDEGDNAKLTYTLTGSDRFTIDNKTGVITVAKPLDREAQAKHLIHVSATDQGDPPLSDVSTIEIVCGDVNDNPPVFLHSNYSVSISEDSAVGTSILAVSAVDPDSGANGRVTYHFAPNNTDNGTFHIDPTSGDIRIDRPLDRETRAQYKLTVVAVDKGSPQQSSEASVLVTITDVNDCSPRFQRESYHLYIKENSPIGSVVGRIIAEDLDEGKNAEIVYKIFGGSDMSAFELATPSDKSGLGVDIVTRVELDFESRKNVFAVQIQAASGELSSIADVFIHVLDINDHRPVLKDFFIVFNNYRDHFPLHSLGKVPAYDPDVNDTLVYSLMGVNSNELLMLNSKTGEILLSSNLNTNRQIQTVVKICVTDGVNTECADCTLVVFLVTETVLMNSVTIRVRDVTAESFLTPVSYSRFIDAIASIVPTRRNDVVVFSVKQDTEVVESLVLNISFSVRQQPHDSWMSADSLEELVFLNRKSLSDITGLEILPFDDNLCVREPCLNYMRCQSVLQFGNASNFIVTDNFIFRPIFPQSTFVCVCPPGYAGMKYPNMCDTEVNLCYSSPCMANGTCVPKESGYVCLCPSTHTGPNCEYPTVNSVCLPGICHGGSNCESDDGHIQCTNCPHSTEFSTDYCQLRSRSFTPTSFVTLPPLKQRHHFTIQLSFVTSDIQGLLFYNGRYRQDHDFIALELVNGRLKFSYSLGGLSPISQLVLESERSLADGTWHTVIIDYFNRSVVMSVDDCDVELSLKFSTEVGYTKCASKFEQKLFHKCSNPSVPCYRFLDLIGPFYLGGLPRHSSPYAHLTSKTFEGCIRDLTIDRKLVDLNNILLNHGSTPGCSYLNDRCRNQQPCVHSADRCENIWKGYRCDCKGVYDGQNCSQESHLPIQLLTFESFVKLDHSAMAKLRLPFSIGFNFRTWQTTSVLLNVELTDGRAIRLMVINKRPAVDIMGKIHQMFYPEISDGIWHHLRLQVEFDKAKLTVDHIQTELIDERIVEPSGVAAVVVGRAGSSTSESGFLGCIKGVKVDNNGRSSYLAIGEQKQTKIGCEAENSCLSSPCPTHSICEQKWNSYSCKCLPGYVGAKCIDVCKVNPCKSDGKCHRTETGYICKCKPNYSGKYCETSLVPYGNSCPKGWWGYPVCGPCMCDEAKGYDPNCNQRNGRCQCKVNHFRMAGSDVCLPCDCYTPGSLGSHCDSTNGQCRCRGNILGRRCDHCQSATAQINSKLASCEEVTDGCPAMPLADIVWSKSQFDTFAREKCPKNSKGVATRKCRLNGGWDRPNLFNCSSDRFVQLGSLLRQLDLGLNFSSYLALKTASDLTNVTKDGRPFYGQDIYTAYRLLMSLIRFELLQSGLGLSHTRDKNFAKFLISTSSAIVAPDNLQWWLQLMGVDGDGPIQSFVGSHFVETLESYGVHLARNHRSLYMEPFQVVTDNIVFALDTIPSGSSLIQLPKYNNFIRQLGSIDSQVGIRLKISELELTVVFYAIYSTVQTILPLEVHSSVRRRGYPLSINSPVLSLYLNSENGKSISEPVDITFQLLRLQNHSGPQCVYWQSYDAGGFWSSLGCHVAQSNLTHVRCGCSHLSTFAVLMDFTDETFVLTSDLFLPYFGPLCVTVSAVILAAALVVSVCMKGVGTTRDSIHRAITSCLLLTIVTFSFVTIATEDQIGCKIVAALLHYGFTSLFAWLFLSLAHLYRSITDLRDLNQASIIPYCIIGWGLPIVVGTTAFMLSKESFGNRFFCWLSLFDGYVWTMIGPVSAVVLVIVYVAGMCVMVVFSREWEIVGAKMRTNLTATLGLALLSFLLFMMALVSVNLQYLWIHYAYHLLIVAIAIADLIFHVFLNTVDLKSAITVKRRKRQTQADKKTVANPQSNCSSRPETPPREDYDMDSSAFHEKSCNEVEEDTDCATVDHSLHLKMFPSDLHLVRGEGGSFLVDQDQNPVDNDRWVALTECDGYQLALLRNTEKSKPDLIPSPDQNYCIAGTLPLSFSRPGPNSAGLYYKVGTRYPVAPLRGPSSNSLSSASFSTFRRPILSPAPEILSSSHSSCDYLPSDHTTPVTSSRYEHPHTGSEGMKRKFETLPLSRGPFNSTTEKLLPIDHQGSIEPISTFGSLLRRKDDTSKPRSETEC